MYSPNIAIRILLADDHEIYRDGMRELLKREPSIDLVAEAANGKQLLSLADQYKPEVILTDVQMPEMNGIEATKLLSVKYPLIPVIALTSFDEAYSIIDMLAAGAKGYLLKDAHKSEIIEAIKTVYNNKPYYCRTTEGKLKKLIIGNIYDPEKKVKRINLSAREREVLVLICEQKSNNEISEQLQISVRTVEGFRKKLILKTKSRNIAGVILFAINNRLI